MRVDKCTHNLQWRQGVPAFSDGDVVDVNIKVWCDRCSLLIRHTEQVDVSGPTIDEWLASLSVEDLK